MRKNSMTFFRGVSDSRIREEFEREAIVDKEAWDRLGGYAPRWLMEYVCGREGRHSGG